MGDATGSGRIVIRWRMTGKAEAIGNSLHRAYPADEGNCYDDALDAIDEAERNVWNPDGAADKLD